VIGAVSKPAGDGGLEAEFRRVTGLSPRQFIELCLVIGTPYRTMNAGSLISGDPAFFVEKEPLRQHENQRCRADFVFRRRGADGAAASSK
jgi:hypothetical protein